MLPSTVETTIKSALLWCLALATLPSHGFGATSWSLDSFVASVHASQKDALLFASFVKLMLHGHSRFYVSQAAEDFTVLLGDRLLLS